MCSARPPTTCPPACPQLPHRHTLQENHIKRWDYRNPNNHVCVCVCVFVVYLFVLFVFAVLLVTLFSFVLCVRV